MEKLNNGWTVMALRILASVLILFVTGLVGYVMNGQQNLESRMANVEIVSTVNTAAMKRVETQLGKIDAKLDRLIEKK